MRPSAPRLRGVGALLGGLKKVYADYVVWRDRRDDERCAAAAKGDAIESEPFALSDRRIRADPDACPRSVLVIPADGVGEAHRRQQRGGALADAVMIDMTYCRGHGREARENILRFLREREGEEKKAAEDPARYVVRVNSPEFDSTNGLLDMELVGLLGERIEGVALPAVTANTYSLIEEFVHPKHRLWAVFDTPLSVLQASEICRQGRYQYAVMGLRELAGDLRPSIDAILRSDKYKDDVYGDIATQATLLGLLPALHNSLQLMLAARAYGMRVLDGLFDDASDTVGFHWDVRRSRSLGFDGKLVARPSQVAPCHAAFAPTAEELAWAKRVQQRLARLQCGAGRREAAQWQRAGCFLQRQIEAELEKMANTDRKEAGLD